MLIASFLQKRLLGAVKDKQDRMFRQVILVYILESYKKNDIFPVFSTLLGMGVKKNLKSPDVYLRRSAIVALGSSEFSFGNIKKLESCLKSSDFYTRKAAAGSLASLTLEHDKGNLRKLNQDLVKMHKSIRESLAWLYYYRRLDIGIFTIPKSKRNFSFLKKEKISPKELLAVKSAIQVSPHSSFFYELASIYFRIKEYKKAKNMLKKALDYSEKKAKKDMQNLDKFRSYTLLGKIYMNEKKYKQALTYLQKAQKENPFSYQIQKYLANCYFSLRNFSKAKDHYYSSHLASPEKENKKFAALWDSLGSKHFTQKKNLIPGARGYFLPYLAHDYLKNGKKSQCIEIFRLIKEIVDLRRDFFREGVFRSLYHHPWIKKLPK